MGYSTARCLMLSPYLSSKSWADFRGSASPATLYFFTHSLTVPCVTTMGGRLSVRALCNKYGEHINYITYIGPDPLYVCGMIYIYIYIYIYHIIYSLHIYICILYIHIILCCSTTTQKTWKLARKEESHPHNFSCPGSIKSHEISLRRSCCILYCFVLYLFNSLTFLFCLNYVLLTFMDNCVN